MIHKMNDVEIMQWAVGALTAVIAAIAKTFHSRLNAYEKSAAKRDVQMATMIAKLDNCMDVFKDHMEHEEREDAELKAELKEIRGEINELKLNLARMPKRKDD